MARTCHRSRATGRRGGLGPGRMVWAARAASQLHLSPLSKVVRLPQRTTRYAPSLARATMGVGAQKLLVKDGNGFRRGGRYLQ